jgi:hypothetical protein
MIIPYTYHDFKIRKEGWKLTGQFFGLSEKVARHMNNLTLP